MTDRDPFIITGTGRSGTTYCQAVLRICGIDVTHQQTFTHEATLAGAWHWAGQDGEASFMAVPLLPLVHREEPTTTIVLVTRDPDAVARSWCALGVFADTMPVEYPAFNAVLVEHCHGVLDQPTAYERARAYVECWNTLARPYAHIELDLDRMQPADLFDAIGRCDAYDAVLAGAVSTTINHRPVP